MTERGMVTEIQGKLVTVQLEMQEGCAACSNSSCKDSRQTIKAYNRDGLDLSEGQSVEVAIEGKAQLLGAMWVLGLPLVLFIGGYLAGKAVFPGSAEAVANAAAGGAGIAAAEGPPAICGLAGLVLGMVVGVLIQKGKRLESLPRVLDVLAPSVMEAVEGTDLGGGEA